MLALRAIEDFSGIELLVIRAIEVDSDFELLVLRAIKALASALMRGKSFKALFTFSSSNILFSANCLWVRFGFRIKPLMVSH